MSLVPQYVVDRVTQPVPEGSSVIPGSTPVVWFGSVATAQVATLGLNPSRAEFTKVAGAGKGQWLTGEDRRLATYESLGVRSLISAARDQVEQIVAECNGYFQKNPYWAWFKPLETLVSEALGASYLDGSACHLDLVQWATDPVWRKLPGPVRADLIEADREFLRHQLMHEQVRLVLLNGSAVVDQIKKMGIALAEAEPATAGAKASKIVVGAGYGAVFVGWSQNLQSAFGVTSELKSAISTRVKEESTARGFSLRGPVTAAADGFIEKGATVTSKKSLARLLQDWAEGSDATTIGDVATFGGKAWLTVELSSARVVLNADTKRSAVLEYLAYVDAHDAEDPWHVVTNARGKVNRVVYRTDTQFQGWYGYITQAWTAPGQL